MAMSYFQRFSLLRVDNNFWLRLAMFKTKENQSTKPLLRLGQSKLNVLDANLLIYELNY